MNCHPFPGVLCFEEATPSHMELHLGNCYHIMTCWLFGWLSLFIYVCTIKWGDGKTMSRISPYATLCAGILLFFFLYFFMIGFMVPPNNENGFCGYSHASPIFTTYQSSHTHTTFLLMHAKGRQVCQDFDVKELNEFSSSSTTGGR